MAHGTYIYLNMQELLSEYINNYREAKTTPITKLIKISVNRFNKLKETIFNKLYYFLCIV